jgi:hypothetical protein
MKAHCISCCILACLCLPLQAAEEADVKKLVRAKVEEINNALIKEDFGKIADLTHPKIVKLMGGRDKMISVMKDSTAKMKANGYVIRSVKVGAPSDLVSGGGDSYVVVPFQLEMKVPRGKVTQKSFVIGVSSDRRKTWKFINGSVDRKLIKKVLPELPEKLKLPEKEKPVFSED